MWPLHSQRSQKRQQRRQSQKLGLGAVGIYRASASTAMAVISRTMIIRQLRATWVTNAGSATLPLKHQLRSQNQSLCRLQPACRQKKWFPRKSAKNSHGKASANVAMAATCNISPSLRMPHLLRVSELCRLRSQHPLKAARVVRVMTIAGMMTAQRHVTLIKSILCWQRECEPKYRVTLILLTGSG